VIDEVAASLAKGLAPAPTEAAEALLTQPAAAGAS
jgi:hypothetical protein